MSKKVRKYTKGFKAEAIKLALISVSISGTAKDLGMPEATLHACVHKAKQSGQKAYQLFDGETGPVNAGEPLNENRALLKRLACLEEEKGNLKKGGGVLRQGIRVKNAFIKDHQHQFSVRLCCELMKISRSGFYTG